MRFKKGQEEMVGFAIIIVIVAVIILVFLSISLRSPSSQNTGQNYEIQSFIQASLQYTVEGKILKNIIRDCVKYDKDCGILEGELKDIMEESWEVGEESVIKGYVLEIYSKDLEILTLEQGNQTNNYKGDFQSLPDDVEVNLKLYY